MRSIVETYEVATGRVRVVLETDRRIEAPNWYPSGDALLVNGGGRLFRLSLSAPALEQVDTGFADRCNNDHGLSPDAQWIVLSHHTGRGSEIFRMPVAGGTPEPITGDAPSWWHSFSPDGARLAYVAARDGRRVTDVYTIGAAGGKEVRLTMGEGHCDGPDYAADGSRIYYICDRGGHAQIWVMNTDGSDQRQLFADDRVNWFPHPSPDGRYLVYLAFSPGTKGHPADLEVSLVLCDPEGRDRRPVRAFVGGQGTINVPSWAPDSHAFAYVRYEP